MGAEKTNRADKTIKCMDCGAEFLFSAAEQEFFMSKGFTQPKRCKACRTKKKQNQGRQNENRRN
jgi:hypothetical protein